VVVGGLFVAPADVLDLGREGLLWLMVACQFDAG